LIIKGLILRNRILILAFRIPGLILVILLGMPFMGFTQQDPVYNQYMNNLLAIQPAYAGISEDLSFTAISRAQWIGFDGAPNTNTLTISGSIPRFNVGVGFSIVNDSWGPVKQNGVYLDYAFRVKISGNQFLSFGLKGGANIYQSNLTDLAINQNPDLVFAYDIKSKFLPNAGVGILWHSDRFFLGASSPKILQNTVESDDHVKVYREVLHYYLMGGYVFFLNDVLKFKPTVLYCRAVNTPVYISYTDITANLLVYDRVWVGAAYRFRNSYGLIFQFSVNPQLKFGYSYDLMTFRPTQVNSGTHEFMISYDFVTIRRARHNIPRYF